MFARPKMTQILAVEEILKEKPVVEILKEVAVVEILVAVEEILKEVAVVVLKNHNYPK